MNDFTFFYQLCEERKNQVRDVRCFHIICSIHITQNSHLSPAAKAAACKSNMIPSLAFNEKIATVMEEKNSRPIETGQRHE